jgi:POTRA domain, FtsQ-type/Cell division protein FtsQ
MTPTKTDAPHRVAARPARPGPRIDPRIKERRTAVVRQAGRRRRRILLVAVVAVAVVVGAWFFLHTKVLAARVVTVVGSVHTPDAEIIAAAGLGGHPPLIDVDTGAVAAKVEQLPWVATAAVSRDWPDGVRIVVTERTPVAAVSATAPAGAGTTGSGTTGSGTAGGAAAAGATPAGATPSTTTTTAPTPPTGPKGTAAWALVDGTGRVLADTPPPPAGLVHVVGAAAAGAPGTMLAADRPALAVAASLPKAFAGQVTEVDATAGGQVTLKLTSPVTVNLGTTGQLSQKYEDVAAVLAGAPLTAGDVIDVSVPGSPVVTGG